MGTKTGVKGTYDTAGVTVTIMKLEQSAMREATPGVLPALVPVTARAQLLALHSWARTPETRAKPARADVRYMIVGDGERRN